MTKCIQCGCEHGTVIENMNTGEQIPTSFCKECLFSGTTFKEISSKIEIKDKNETLS